ncbi:unnamed protein product [Cochlearia groenlandica]
MDLAEELISKFSMTYLSKPKFVFRRCNTLKKKEIPSKTISDLPMDLVEDVLYRLPLTSIQGSHTFDYTLARKVYDNGNILERRNIRLQDLYGNMTLIHYLLRILEGEVAVLP